MSSTISSDSQLLEPSIDSSTVDSANAWESRSTTVDVLGNAKTRKLILIGTGLWLASAAILIYFHFAATLVKAHYQYVVLIPPVVAYLLWHRYTAGKLKASAPSVIWIAGWIASLLIIGAASWLFSPWIGMAGLLLVGPATSLALGGWPLFKGTWGIWLVTSFLLPLPLQYDERLIVRLRDVATKITSGILDQFGVLHMISGNVIELPEKKLFVADACSGIHSMFVLMAAAAIVAVIFNRGPIATFLLMVGTFGLVMVENISRLLAVSYSIRFGYDLSEGTGHSVLGFVLFAISLALILSMDQWLAFFSFRRKKRIKRSSASKSITDGRAMLFAVSGGIALLCLPIQFVRMPAAVPNVAAGFSRDLILPSFSLETLPEKLRNFNRDDFEVVNRVADDPFGKQSQIWRYKNVSTEISLSLNYPYREVHDAGECYRYTGWTVEPPELLGLDDNGKAVVNVPSGTAWELTPCQSSEMSNPFEGHALLFYSSMSEDGEIAVSSVERYRTFNTQKLASRFERVTEEDRYSQWIQLQMVVQKDGAFTEDEKKEMEQLYREAQKILFEKCRQSLAIEGS